MQTISSTFIPTILPEQNFISVIIAMIGTTIAP